MPLSKKKLLALDIQTFQIVSHLKCLQYQRQQLLILMRADYFVSAAFTAADTRPISALPAS